MDLLLVEELLLIALDDRQGSSRNNSLHAGLAGAVLTDLARAATLRMEGKLVHPVEGATPEHGLLRRAQQVIVESSRPRTPKAWVQQLPRSLRPFTETVAAGLVDRGVLSEQRHKALGMFATVRFPEADPQPERQLRARLRAVLTGQGRPEEQDALLLGLLTPLQLVDGLVDKSERRAARKRAKEIAEAGIAGDAVSKVVQEVQSAATVAVVAAAAGGAAGGGSG